MSKFIYGIQPTIDGKFQVTVRHMPSGLQEVYIAEPAIDSETSIEKVKAFLMDKLRPRVEALEAIADTDFDIQYLRDYAEGIDAALFSGDAFYDRANVAGYGAT